MEVNEQKKRRYKKKEKTNKLGVQTRKIAKSKLENALKIINDPDHDVWKDRNNACETGIHYYRRLCTYNQETNDISRMELRLRYAQTCLLRRDWNNLAKIILLYKPDKSNEHYLRLFAKYASICLAYTDQPLLESFLQSFNCSETTEDVLRKWTSLPNAK